MREPIPIACSLSAEDQVARGAEFVALGERVVAREPTERGVLLRFRRTPGLLEQLSDLTRREKECCPFFDFHLEAIGEELRLEVGAPPEARPIVEQLFVLDGR